MNHYLFESLNDDMDGEDFIVGANSYTEAREIAQNIFGKRVRFWRELTEEEAEISGLDEY